MGRRGQMTSVERVRTAIAGKCPDRVPLGFYAVDRDTVERIIGRKSFVRDKIGTVLALAEGRREEIAESLKEDSVQLYRSLDCADLILPKEAQLLPPKDYEPEPMHPLDDNSWRDGHGRVWRAVWDKNDLMCVDDPTQRSEFAVEELDESPTPAPPDDSVFEVLDHLAATLGDERYICSYVNIAPMPMLSDFARSLMLYTLQPEVVQAANRLHIRAGELADAAAIRPGTTGLFAEQDMAGSNAPYISPQMFRELCLPTLRRRVEQAKRYRAQLIYHNCGMNIPLMEMFIEAGVDCYQSLQTTAGMEIGRLKELCGDRMAFWGGMPVEVLVGGTPEQTRQCVRDALERGAPGGGFIFGPSHSIAYGTRYDNFMTMLEEFERLRDRY